MQRLVAALAFIVLVAGAGERVLAKASFSVSPAQSWVREISPDLGKTPGPSPATAGSVFLLDDHQIRIGEKTIDRYYHHVQRIDTTAGLDDLSQLKFDFEPSYQQLTIHTIRILRENSIINALNSGDIRVIQQEEDLDERLYNGTFAALVFLNDLRVGDTVEYSYSISGENPVLNGLFADTLYLASDQPIEQLLIRLVCPSKRSLSFKYEKTDMQPAVSAAGNNTEYVWQRRDVAAISVDDSTPEWFDAYPTVTISEFRSWADVVQWALPLYKLPAAHNSGLLAKTARLKQESSSQAAQAVAALRFVQDEIRYLGIEMGRYSHQPTPPAKVFARRFGDCKDKSMLLVEILTDLGIDAAPALVNSTRGRALDGWQPSPFAFDHVIVQAKLDGKTYWFDPTISYQRGTLEQYYDPPYERALVLRPGITGLERIPVPGAASSSLSVREIYRQKDVGAPITLEVISLYRGSEADEMRYTLASESLAELGKSYVNFYAENNPSIRAAGLPVVSDDTVNNTIEVKERYLIDQFWREGRHRFIADKILDSATRPNVLQRSMPLKIDYPRSVAQTIEIDLPGDYEIRDDQGTNSDDALEFEYGYAHEGHILKLKYALNARADFLPAEKTQSHLMLIDKIRSLAYFDLNSPVNGVLVERTAPTSKALDLVLGFLVLPLIAALSILAIRGKLKRRSLARFLKSNRPAAGASPETSLEVDNETQLDPLLRRFKCKCGKHPFNPESPPLQERFTYDGQLLIGIRLHCGSCLQNNDLYVKLQEVVN